MNPENGFKQKTQWKVNILRGWNFTLSIDFETEKFDHVSKNINDFDCFIFTVFIDDFDKQNQVSWASPWDF